MRRFGPLLLLPVLASLPASHAESLPGTDRERIDCLPTQAFHGDQIVITHEGTEILAAEIQEFSNAKPRRIFSRALQSDGTHFVFGRRYRIDHSIDCMECWDKWVHVLFELDVPPNPAQPVQVRRASDMVSTPAFDLSILRQPGTQTFEYRCMRAEPGR